MAIATPDLPYIWQIMRTRKTCLPTPLMLLNYYTMNVSMGLNRKIG